jgi:hypothetical protein
MSRPTRTGGYPLMNLAEDWKVPYDVLLRYSDAVAPGKLLTKADLDAVKEMLRCIPTPEGLTEMTRQIIEVNDRAR